MCTVAHFDDRTQVKKKDLYFGTAFDILGSAKRFKKHQKVLLVKFNCLKMDEKLSVDMAVYYPERNTSFEFILLEGGREMERGKKGERGKREIDWEEESGER